MGQAEIGRMREQADDYFRKEAFDRLAERLRNGEQVGRCTFRDLIDCEVNSDRYALLLGELDTLLCGEGGNDTVEGFASKVRDGIIERHLNAPEQEWLIEEEAAALEAAE